MRESTIKCDRCDTICSSDSITIEIVGYIQPKIPNAISEVVINRTMDFCPACKNWLEKSLDRVSTKY